MIESTNNQVELPKIRFYGDRKRRSSKSVQIIDLDKSFENNNGDAGDSFRNTENGNSIENQNGDENGNNGNNNDENFNNNNDFNCLDSNNTLQNGNVILEMQEAVQNIPIDGQIIDANVERLTTEELMEYQQEACDLNDEIVDEIKTESDVQDNIDEMEVDQTPITKMEQSVNGQDTEMINADEINPKVEEMTNEIGPNVEETKTVDNIDAKVSESDIKVSKSDPELDASIGRGKKDSDVELLNDTPEKIDLTLDDDDDDVEKVEPNQISIIKDDDKLDVDPVEQNNDSEPEQEQDEEDQKSENEQSPVADRSISQSITLKEPTIVLLE
jgi:hypothetical protein